MRMIRVSLIFVFVLASCKPADKGPSIFQDQLCGRLCWNNIVIGKSNINDLNKLVPTLPNVVKDSIVSYDSTDVTIFDKIINFRFNRISGDNNTLVRVSILTRNGVVSYITFQGDLGLIFEDVDNIFGEPTFALSFWSFEGGINVNFLNDTNGTAIFSAFNSEKAYVNPQTQVDNLSLFDPSLYQIFLENNILTPDYPGFTLHPWVGYGQIEDYYWPPR